MNTFSAAAAVQVLREGVWHLVKPQRGALTINVGDMAQVGGGVIGCT